jgi:hypothetical protein
MRYFRTSLRSEGRPSSEDETYEPATVKGSVGDTETVVQRSAGPADREGAGVEEGRVHGNEGRASEAVVQIAGMWHPLVSNYGSGYGPYDSSKPRQCDSAAEKKCMCGPPPVTVVTGCDKITYDPCENTLRCSSTGYYS